MNPLISIITVQYGHSHVTLELLRSLKNISYRNIEIIVVDNASSGFRAEQILTEFPDITLIVNNKNLGFAGGNNVGIARAKGDYILLLNNDTEVHSGFLEPLISKMESNPLIGIVSPKIRFYHSPDIIQFVGYNKLKTFTLRGKPKGFGAKDEGQFDKDEEIFYGHGAAMMVRKSAIDKAGMMPEIYFLYYEELDWAHRIRTCGYKIFYVNNSLVFHKESISTGGRMNPLKAYYMPRNRILFIRRNYTGLELIIALFYQYLIAVPKNILLFIIKGQFHLAKNYFKGAIWNLYNSAEIENKK